MAAIKKKWWQGKNGPLLIAEIGANHEGNFNYAKKLLKICSKTNVDVVKFQIYEGSSIVNKILAPEKYNHFKKFELTKKQHLFLASMAKKLGMKYLSSVWNKKDLKWISRKMDFFKIGSGDLNAYEIINEICKYKKPIILSTGLSEFKEVEKTIKFIRSRNNFYKIKENIAILQCTSCYPTNSDELNLSVIKSYEKKGFISGYSHHHPSSLPLEIAYAYGAKIFEFHFTDSRKNRKFRDHKISLDYKRTRNLVKKFKEIQKMSGISQKKPTENEIKLGYIKSFRRGLYLNKSLKKGDIVRKKDLVSLRPAEGIPSNFYFKILNKKLKKNITKLSKLSLKDFSL